MREESEPDAFSPDAFSPDDDPTVIIAGRRGNGPESAKPAVEVQRSLVEETVWAPGDVPGEEPRIEVVSLSAELPLVETVAGAGTAVTMAAGMDSASDAPEASILTDDSTVILGERTSNDETVGVAARFAAPSADSSPHGRQLRRRTLRASPSSPPPREDLVAMPVPPGNFGPLRRGSGPGILMEAESRSAIQFIVSGDSQDESPASTRETLGLPSVVAQSRRISRWALTAVAVVATVSILGLGWIVLQLISG